MLGRVTALDEGPNAWEATPGAGPVDVEQWSPEQLREQYRAVLSREAQLRKDLAAARASGANQQPVQPTAARPPGAPDPPPNPLKEKFYPTSPERLAELARDCTVRVDNPPVLDSTPGELGNVADELHASPAEERAMREVVAELHRSVRGELSSLYAEVVGRAPSAELSSRALLSEIFDKTPASERSGVMDRIARE